MPRRPIRAALILVTALALAVGTAGPGLGATDSTAGGGRTNRMASAYGTFVTASGAVVSGKTAPSGLGSCGTFSEEAQSANTVAGVDASPALRTGAVNTTAEATFDSSRATSTVDGVNILEGLITARTVTAVANTRITSEGLRSNANGSAFENLVVAGVPIIIAPAPNTRIELVGFGHVILNQQQKRSSPVSAGITVNMINVFVTVENPLVPVGTRIIVASASSAIQQGIGGTTGGFAYGSAVNVLSLVVSGPSALVRLGCFGTEAEKTNTIAGIVLPPALVTGTITNRVSGTVTQTTAVSDARSLVEGVNVADGLVTATAVEAVAHADTDGTDYNKSSQGSGFVGLQVAGFPEIGDDVPPNTQLQIPGLGTLWLYRVIEGPQPGRIEVRMIELIVTTENSLGLPVGTRIRVAVADAVVR